MSLLDQLGRKYGTDKASGSHNYLWLYERYLERFRARPITLLEMGVGEGKSLFMWRDYFPLGRIVGLDIRDDRQQFAGDRIIIVQGDQADGDVLHRLVQSHGPFDIIVDDAGHHPDAQVFAHKTLLPHLTPGGVYILEDVGGQGAIDYLTGLASRVIRNQDTGSVRRISFYHETSITVMDGEVLPDHRLGEVSRQFQQHVDALADLAQRAREQLAR